MIAGIGTRFTLPSVHASQSVELIYPAREKSIDHEVINFIPILLFSLSFFMDPSSRMEKIWQRSSIQGSYIYNSLCQIDKILQLYCKFLCFRYSTNKSYHLKYTLNMIFIQILFHLIILFCVNISDYIKIIILHKILHKVL